MKLSIVTISFNQCKFLKRCMDSVLTQRSDLEKIGVELEYIVVDPGSTDGSRELIESYGDQVIKVFEKDDGPADGLNKGFTLATGDFYAYINADDYFLSGAFDCAIKIFENSDCDVLTAHGWVVDENDKKSHRCLSHKFSLQQYAMGNCVVMQQSTFFKRDAFLKVGGFNKDNRICWDGELVVDMAISGARIIRSNEFISCFRVYSESISGSGNYLEAAKIEHLKIKRKIEKALGLNVATSNLFRRLIFRVSDPVYVLLRIVDAIQYGKRVIPT